MAVGGTAAGTGVVVVQRFDWRRTPPDTVKCSRCGSRVLREWTNIILWLAASAVFFFLSLVVFLPVIRGRWL